MGIDPFLLRFPSMFRFSFLFLFLGRRGYPRSRGERATRTPSLNHYNIFSRFRQSLKRTATKVIQKIIF
ncbi:MAG: hypothetical protein NC237_12960, partial [Eubacterium sp.]|nr:hypothetical protein [Eubacterium sp.]